MFGPDSAVQEKADVSCNSHGTRSERDTERIPDYRSCRATLQGEESGIGKR